MNWRRERNRKERAKAEMEAVIARYDLECGLPKTRKATPEELKRKGRKDHITAYELKRAFGYISC